MLRKTAINFLSLCVILSGGLSAAQTPDSKPLLTRAEAVNLMLENNYGIKVARLDEEVAENNSGILNSGYLPSLQGTAGAQYDETTSTTSFEGALDDMGNPREDVTIPDAETQTYDAAIAVNYTLFDGLGRYYSYQRLQVQYNLSQLQARSTIENTTVQLMSVYLEVARLAENLEVLNKTLAISKERERRAQLQFEYGQVNKLEVLNARVDINTDSTNVLNARQSLENTKRDLNLLLNRELEAQFQVDTTVTFTNLIQLETYLQDSDENNVRLLQAASSVQITEYDIKTSKALLLPRIGLTGSYGWNRQNNPPSAFFPATVRTSTSLRLGANLTWDIFDGGNSINNIRNAKLARETEEYQREQINQEVARDLANARGNYLNSLTVFRMQEQNVETNEDNFRRSEEQFKLGQITGIEFRQAQINLLNAETQKNLAKYDAKLAEYQLLQFTGQLLNVNL